MDFSWVFMEKHIFIKKQYNTDIELIQCGTQKCAHCHSYGPGVRDHYLIHYVLSGKGIFRTDDNTYSLQKGNGFLIFPEELTYYEADAGDPWEYIWVGFSGIKALELLQLCGLDENNPVFLCPEIEPFMLSMITSDSLVNPELHILAKLYEMLSCLSQASDYTPVGKADVKKQYVSDAINFISSNYMKNISIGMITKEIGLNRSYFYSIFKNQTGVSPRQFLIDCRIEAACRLLRQTSYKISDVARSVGYEDEFMFSRMFTSKKGLSPLKYRKSIE